MATSLVVRCLLSGQRDHATMLAEHFIIVQSTVVENSMNDTPAALHSGDVRNIANIGLGVRQEVLTEYYYVQDLIDRYGERRQKVKSWSVTSCGVALGFGIVENSSVLFGLAAFGSWVFWYLEGLWRARQQILIQRAYTLEELLATGCKDYVGPQISETFRGANALQSTLPLKSFFYRSVRVPYYFIFCVGILLFLFSLMSARLQAIIGP